MRVLVDTNICLDILQKRPEFYDLSKNALFLASAKKFNLFITTATVMDIMYITRKHFQDNSFQKSVVQEFVSAFNLLKVSKGNIKYAFSGGMKDFEDAVQADCAKRHFINVILTRNVKDFVNSPVKALSPKDFITQFNK